MVVRTLERIWQLWILELRLAKDLVPARELVETQLVVQLILGIKCVTEEMKVV